MVKLPDEPLYKEAIVPVVPIAKTLARGVGRLFASAGDNVVGMLAKWWKKGAPVEAVMKLKPLREIPDTVHQAKLLDSQIGKEITEGMEIAHKSILDNIRSTDSNLRAISNKVDMSRRQLNVLNDRLRDPTKVYPGLKTTVERHQQYLDSLVGKESELVDKLQTLKGIDITIKTNPQSVAAQLDSMPQIMAEFPSLGRWKGIAETQIARKDQIMRATSRHLGSDKKFLKEYINEIAPLDNKNPYKIAWLANTDNLTRLTKLQTQPKYMKQIVGVGEVAARTNISGLGATQIAKKLGIGVGMAGAVGATIGIFSWAGKSGEEIDQNAEDIGSLLMSARSSGLGEVVLDDIKVSISKINVASDNLKIGLSSKPRESFAAYFEVLTTEKEKIDKNLRQWGAVAIGSDNPEEMKKLGTKLQSFSARLEAKLKEVSKILEGAGAISVTPSLGIPGVAPNILKTQQYLGVFASGILDDPTISALRRLEAKYNRIAETDRFTGLLYNPTTKKVMDLVDLKNLEKIVK
jgi:predicted DNA-binding protein YlxM (UPF0122 family)